MNDPMRLLVTGGCGFIGTHLVRRLVALGHEVLNLDKLTYAGATDSLADLDGTPNYRFARLDIADSAAVRAAFSSFRPEAVLHLAAESHVDRSISGPAAFVQSNIVGTFTLLEAARELWLDPRSGIRRPRFLHVSTDEVYGSLAPGAPAFTESSPYDPRSPYSASKAAADHLARAWHSTYGLPVLVTNCSNNYGPWQFPEKLVPVVIVNALRGRPIPVYGDGGNVRDWLFVEDHVSALLAVLERGQPGRTYHIGGDHERENLDLVRRLCRIVDEEAAAPAGRARDSASLIAFVPDRPGHDRRYAIDATRLRDELGWRPRHDPDTALRETVRWYLENEAWWGALG